MNIAKYFKYLCKIGRETDAYSLYYIVGALGKAEAIETTKELIAEGKLPEMPEE